MSRRLIDGNGVATGLFLGCRTTGQAAPHPGGKNLLNVSMTLDPATCAPGTSTTLRTFVGFVLTFDLIAGGRRQFAYLSATDLTQWDWEEFFLTASSP